MFYQAALQVYVRFNMFLQRDDPLIPVLSSEVNNFLKKLFSRFIKVGAIQDVEGDIVSLDYGNEENHLPGIPYHEVPCKLFTLFLDASLFVGIMTRQLIMRLEQDGDISSNQIKKFYKGVRLFYTSAVDYAIENLPLNDNLLKNAEFVYFPKRNQATISQVVYFVTRLVVLLCTYTKIMCKTGIQHVCNIHHRKI